MIFVADPLDSPGNRLGPFARSSHAGGQPGITGTHFMSGER
jgi:hypothetical protein